MTRRSTRPGARRRPARRRPPIIRGRRFALGLALAGAVLAPGGIAAADVHPDQQVQATIYQSGTSTPHPPVSIATLENTCQTTSEPDQVYDHAPKAITPVVPTANTFSLSEVLQCGFGVSTANISAQGGVVVLQDGMAREPLSRADLSPQGTNFTNGEFPIIWDNGTGLEAFRPWRGGSDYNAGDHVTEDNDSPLVLEVFEGPLLTVTASPGSETVAAATTVSFSATARDANGNSPPLTYAWTFDGGAPASSSATPTETFAPGRYSVTVQVTDAMGGGGAATMVITVSPADSNTGTQPQNGPGTSTQPNAPATGPQHSSGTTPGGISGKPHARRPGTSGRGTRTPGSGARRPQASAPTTKSAAPLVTSTPVNAPTSPASPRPSAAPTATPAKTPSKGAPGPGSPARVIDGRLISNVTPLPLEASPLVSVVRASVDTAPPVRRAIRASALPALGAALAIAVLLALGAGRELRWWRNPGAGLLAG